MPAQAADATVFDHPQVELEAEALQPVVALPPQPVGGAAA